MPPLLLETALALLSQASDEAARRGLARVAVVVTDAGGAVRAGQRADGQGAFAFDIAHAKARTALGFLKSSLLLAGHFQAAAASTVAINGVTAGQFVPIGGGVVLTDAHGTPIGAAAVAGGAPETDDAIVRAAAQAVGLHTLP